MAGIVSNIIQNSLSGMVAGAVTTVGGYAGDAIGSVGNMVEYAGCSVGEGGINNSIARVGSTITSYGDATIRATAPSAGGYSSAPKTAVKQAEPVKSKPAAKKEPQKALPSTQPMKALPAPAGMTRSKSAETVTSKASAVKTKGTRKPYDPTGSSYKATGSSYASPTAKKPEQKTALNGKVIISAASRPGGAATTSKPETKPFQPYKPSAKPYEPPKPRLTESNLKSVPSSAAHIPGYAHSAAGSVKTTATQKTKGPAGARADKATAALSKAGSVRGVSIDRKFF